MGSDLFEICIGKKPVDFSSNEFESSIPLEGNVTEYKFPFGKIIFSFSCDHE